MRKILLATTAILGVAFAGAAQAAPASPISLQVGGYTDFVAGFQNHGSAGNNVGHDFETEYKLAFDAMGKGSNGIEYGANISLWNGSEVNNLWANGVNTGAGIQMNSAYVWMSGAFGKLLMGDEHGASDLFVYAPTVGEGQVDGRYTDFVSFTRHGRFFAAGFDNTEHSTKITYYTPKVGNDTHKVQLGVSYAPSLYDYGQFASTTPALSGVSPYTDVTEVVAQYKGNFKPVNVTASAQWIRGGGGGNALSTYTLGGGQVAANGSARSFNAWGLGANIGWNGWTFGGAYNDMGAYNVVNGQNKEQDNWNLGLKYEFDKVGVAANYLHGKGYQNYLTGGTAAVPTSNTNYIKDFDAGSVGATYTWFPGLTSNIDGVLYGETIADQAGDRGGYTVLVSQRLAF